MTTPTCDRSANCKAPLTHWSDCATNPRLSNTPTLLPERDAQTELNDAVMYALKEGCFFPVPEPEAGASTRELIQWGAMRNLHKAIARFNNERSSIAGVPATCVKCGHRATVNGICEVGMPERGKDEYGYNVKCGCKCGFPAVPAQRAAHDLAEKIVEYVNINDDYNADGITAIIEEECSRGIEEQAEQEQG